MPAKRKTIIFRKCLQSSRIMGYVTIRLSDDWQGFGFIAYHVDVMQSLKVQLKGRLTVYTKYQDKGIWICFKDQKNKNVWFLF